MNDFQRRLIRKLLLVDALIWALGFGIALGRDLWLTVVAGLGVAVCLGGRWLFDLLERE